MKKKKLSSFANTYCFNVFQKFSFLMPGVFMVNCVLCSCDNLCFIDNSSYNFDVDSARKYTNNNKNIKTAYFNK